MSRILTIMDLPGVRDEEDKEEIVEYLDDTISTALDRIAAKALKSLPTEDFEFYDWQAHSAGAEDPDEYGIYYSEKYALPQTGIVKSSAHIDIHTRLSHSGSWDGRPGSISSTLSRKQKSLIRKSEVQTIISQALQAVADTGIHFSPPFQKRMEEIAIEEMMSTPEYQLGHQTEIIVDPDTPHPGPDFPDSWPIIQCRMTDLIMDIDHESSIRGRITITLTGIFEFSLEDNIFPWHHHHQSI